MADKPPSRLWVVHYECRCVAYRRTRQAITEYCPAHGDTHSNIHPIYNDDEIEFEAAWAEVQAYEKQKPRREPDP